MTDPFDQRPLLQPRQLEDETLRDRSIRLASAESELPGFSPPEPEVKGQQRRYDEANEEFDRQRELDKATPVNDQMAYQSFADTRQVLGMPPMATDTATQILEGGK